MAVHPGRRHGERGMITAEYGVGVLCTAVIACGLVTLVDAGWFAEFLVRIFDVSFNRTLADLVSSLW
jgi:hypothetical protein